MLVDLSAALPYNEVLGLPSMCLESTSRLVTGSTICRKITYRTFHAVVGLGSFLRNFIKIS